MKLFIGVVGIHLSLAGAILVFGNTVKGGVLLLMGVALATFGFWPEQQARNESLNKEDS